MKNEREEKTTGKKRVKFGIVPKMLLGILVPLFVVLLLISVFLGLRSSKTVNQVKGAELNAESKYAASEVDSFF